MGQDMVNHPLHYNQYTQEVIDTITEWVKDYGSVEGYYIGTVLKYLARAPYKGKKLEDLKKASFYLQEAIEYIKKQESSKSAKNGQDFLDDFIKAIAGLGSQPIKMTANVNDTDGLMESIKNGTNGDQLIGTGKPYESCDLCSRQKR